MVRLIQSRRVLVAAMGGCISLGCVVALVVSLHLLLTRAGPGPATKGRRGLASVRGLTWEELHTRHRREVFEEDWLRAVGVWGEMHIAFDRSSLIQVEQWIDFQVEVIRQTRDQPLKHPLHRAAIQEIALHPEVALKHYDWLKGEVESGAFADPFVRQWAQEALEGMELIFQLWGEDPDQAEIFGRWRQGPTRSQGPTGD